MAKLSANIRALALKDIAKGMSNAELIAKYSITSSAVNYLKKMATGSTPRLKAFKENLGAYCPERILRLALQGVDAKELAEDYETSTSTMKAYLSVVMPQTPSKARVVHGQNKQSTKKKRKR